MPVPFLRKITKRSKGNAWSTTRYLGWITGKEYGRYYTLSGGVEVYINSGQEHLPLKLDTEKLLSRVEYHAKRLGTGVATEMGHE